MSIDNHCLICDSKTDKFSTTRILKKYDIEYYRCSNCGFVQTEKPFWLEEAYSEAVSHYDLGSVNRTIVNASICESYILQYFDCNAKFVDYGAGYGLLVRRMRDMGFDFYWYDTYCQNLFAQNFKTQMDTHDRFELLTAFEVFEHLVNPNQTLKEMLSFSENILFSTELVPPSNPKPGEWWYYFPLHGQHVSFYTLKSLSVLAQSNNLVLTSNKKNIHLLTKNPLNKTDLIDRARLKIFKNVKSLRNKLNKQSLLEDDFNKYKEEQ